MHDIVLKIAILSATGIFAQWAAWRLRLPAIALLLLAGLLLGPLSYYFAAEQFILPSRDFGALYRPIIALAVAIILFEGGLSLKFAEIRETSTAVRRIILFGGPLVWLSTTLAGHYIANLTWPTAATLGAILVVTGPTVIMPLLRQARLNSRPASLLRWEAIINDPIGALFAVLTFECILVLNGQMDATDLAGTVIIAAIASIFGGFAIARMVVHIFTRGWVPEYLKAPVLIALVLISYAASNLILEESGLLTVTIMGLTLGNSKIASLGEMRRFKETITTLLVSGVFILLTASLNLDDLFKLQAEAIYFVLAILFIIRPCVIFLVTWGSGLNWREQLLVGWIAPRGIVAVAVSGLFGQALYEQGIVDAKDMISLTFVVVASTIVLHGFSLSPLAALLRLKSTEKPGFILIGGSTWTHDFAKKLRDEAIPVLITDNNWSDLKAPRLDNIPIYFGEILSEEAHHHIDFNRYQYLIAATDNSAYNALVCTEFGPEIGRSHVFQIGTHREENERNTMHFTLGGRQLFKPGMDARDLRIKTYQEWVFNATELSDEYGYDDYKATRSEGTHLLFWQKPNGDIIMAGTAKSSQPAAEDKIFSFGPKPATVQNETK